MNDTKNVPSTVISSNLLPNLQDFNMYQTIAKNAQISGLYSGVGGESKIFMILLAARELGIGPCAALNGGIWNIQGKIEISARLMSAMIRKAGHSISFKQNDAKACVLIGKRADTGDTMEASFTIEDAHKAGLSNRDVWKKYTEDMLYARCLSRLARRLYADVIGTAYVEGEIRESNDLKQAEYEDITAKKIDVPQISIEHTVEPNDMVQDHPKIDSVHKEFDLGHKKIEKQEWTELNKLIDQCSPPFQQKIWDRLAAMGINSMADLDKETFEKMRDACLVNIQKQMNSDKKVLDYATA